MKLAYNGILATGSVGVFCLCWFTCWYGLDSVCSRSADPLDQMKRLWEVILHDRTFLRARGFNISFSDLPPQNDPSTEEEFVEVWRLLYGGYSPISLGDQLLDRRGALPLEAYYAAIQSLNSLSLYLVNFFRNSIRLSLIAKGYVACESSFSGDLTIILKLICCCSLPHNGMPSPKRLVLNTGRTARLGTEIISRIDELIKDLIRRSMKTFSLPSFEEAVVEMYDENGQMLIDSLEKSGFKPTHDQCCRLFDYVGALAILACEEILTWSDIEDLEVSTQLLKKVYSGALDKGVLDLKRLGNRPKTQKELALFCNICSVTSSTVAEFYVNDFTMPELNDPACEESFRAASPNEQP